MHVRSYTGQSISDLLYQIHRAHGDDALILHTHRRGDQVEVEVALKNAVVSPPSFLAHPSEVCLASHVLRRSLSSQERREPLLLKNALLEALRVYCGVMPLTEGVPYQDRMIFEGRPGVGKTTVLLKIATQCVLQERPLHILTLDDAKTSDISPLLRFSFHTGIPVQVVDQPQNLLEMIKACPSHHRVWIDTPGWGRDDQVHSHRVLFQELVWLQGFTRCLVHDGLSEVHSSIRLVDTFMKSGGQCLALTKLDLLHSPENVVRTLSGLSRAYFLGHSQSPSFTDALQPLPLETWASWMAQHV